MHLNRFREADGLARQPLNSGAQRQMLAFDLLGIAFAWLVLIGIDMTGVSTPIVCVILRDAKGFQQGFELQKSFILATSKDIGQNFATTVVNGMPKPSLIFLAPHVTLHLISFSFIREPNDNRYLFRI